MFDGSHDDVMNYMKENGYDYHGLVGIDAIFVKRGTKLAKKLKKQRNKKAKEDAIKEKMANKKDELWSTLSKDQY